MILSSIFFFNKNTFTLPQPSTSGLPIVFCQFYLATVFVFVCSFQDINPQKRMGQFWTLLTHLHALAGPVMMLLYPLYASVHAMETATKVDDEQWLAYWILYSFLTLMEMVLEPVLAWIPIWYEIKLVFVGWLVLPQLRGAAFIYNRFVREKLMNRTHFNTTDDDKVAKINDKDDDQSSLNSKKKNKFNIVRFVTPKKVKHGD